MTIITLQQLAGLRQAGYLAVGASKHSAIKVCHWCKKSLLGEGHCYKQEFYGIRSHRCLQCTPALPFCSHKCVFCWRDTSITFAEWKGGVDEPGQLVDEMIRAQQKLLNGFPGNPKSDLEKWKEAQRPKHAAISLSGEPSLYPKLGELVEEFHKKKMTTFLVTNGIYPKVIERLANNKQLPTQLYISLASHSPDSYKRVHAPLVENGWDRFLESLDLMNGIAKERKTRTVLRMTLAKNLNLEAAEEYARLIERSGADFVEVKAYMAVGSSRERLGPSYMPKHEDIKQFAGELAEETGYLETAEHEPSRVVLLCRDEKSANSRNIGES